MRSSCAGPRARTATAFAHETDESARGLVRPYRPARPLAVRRGRALYEEEFGGSILLH